MAARTTLPVRSADELQPHSTRSSSDFKCNVSAVAKGIKGLGVDALTIATASSYRGSGRLGSELEFLSYYPPIAGALYYDSEADLDSGRTQYKASASEDKLTLSFTRGDTPVALFEGTVKRTLPMVKGTTDVANDFEFWYFPKNVRELTFSIFSGEVIAAGTGIYVYFNAAVHHDHDAFHIVRDGIQFHTKVTWKHPSEFAVTISTDSLSAGRYNLVVGELRKQNKNEYVNQFYYVVEFIIGTPVKTPVDFGELQVVHSAQVRLGLGFDGTEDSQEPAIRRVKAVDMATGEPTGFATNESGELVDFEKLVAEKENAHFDNFGFVHKDLYQHIRDLHDDEMVDVVVWAHVPARPGPSGGEGDAYAYPTGPLALSNEAVSARSTIETFIQNHSGQIALQPANEPYLYAAIPKREITALAALDDVGGVFQDDRTFELDLANSVMAAKSDSVVTAGYGGEGVRVAVHEGGPKTLKNLVLAGRYDENPKPHAKSDNHSRLTHAIVKNVEPDHPHGHAPSCLLYSANSTSNLALEWALDSTRACTVLSKSFHRGSEPTRPSLSSDDILYDWKATRWPCPTFSLAAGNFSPGDGKLYVNHKGFNSLKVGSHHDDGLIMAASSEYRNPPSAHGDRELPEIAANGTLVGANEQLSSGTSFAAPAVAGIIALVQQVNLRLKGFPEVCRAILLASASRVVVGGGSWWGDLAAKKEGRAGAGAVDAQRAIDIASAPRCPFARPLACGWDIGLLLSETSTSAGTNSSSAPFIDSKGAAYARYYVSAPDVPVTKAASTSYTVKAALTWNSEVSSDKAGVPIDSRMTVDLDLYVKDAAGRLAALSASFDNNYEIVEFYVRPGDTYELSIVKASGAPNTRYGIAWAVHEVPWAVKRP